MRAEVTEELPPSRAIMAHAANAAPVSDAERGVVISVPPGGASCRADADAGANGSTDAGAAAEGDVGANRDAGPADWDWEELLERYRAAAEHGEVAGGELPWPPTWRELHAAAPVLCPEAEEIELLDVYGEVIDPEDPLLDEPCLDAAAAARVRRKGATSTEGAVLVARGTRPRGGERPRWVSAALVFVGVMVGALLAVTLTFRFMRRAPSAAATASGVSATASGVSATASGVSARARASGVSARATASGVSAAATADVGMGAPSQAEPVRAADVGASAALSATAAPGGTVAAPAGAAPVKPGAKVPSATKTPSNRPRFKPPVLPLRF
jgi:hypothetical protein